MHQGSPFGRNQATVYLLLAWEVQVDVSSTFGHLSSSSAPPYYKTKLSWSQSDRGEAGVDPSPPGQRGAPPGQVTEAKGGHGWAPSSSLRPDTPLFTAGNDAVGSFAKVSLCLDLGQACGGSKQKPGFIWINGTKNPFGWLWFGSCSDGLKMLVHKNPGWLTVDDRPNWY